SIADKSAFGVTPSAAAATLRSVSDPTAFPLVAALGLGVGEAPDAVVAVPATVRAASVAAVSAILLRFVIAVYLPFRAPAMVPAPRQQATNPPSVAVSGDLRDSLET